MKRQLTQATYGSGGESSSQLSAQGPRPSENQAGTVPRNVRVWHSAGSSGNQRGIAPRNGRVGNPAGTRRNQAGNALRNVRMYHPADSTGGNQAGNGLRNINTPPSKGCGLCVLCRTADIPVETRCRYRIYDRVVILHEPKHALVPSDNQLTHMEYAFMYGGDLLLKFNKCPCSIFTSM